MHGTSQQEENNEVFVPCSLFVQGEEEAQNNTNVIVGLPVPCSLLEQVSSQQDVASDCGGSGFVPLIGEAEPTCTNNNNAASFPNSHTGLIGNKVRYFLLVVVYNYVLTFILYFWFCQY